MENKQLEKLKEHIENTIETGFKIDLNIENIEYYNLFCKAAAKNSLYKLYGNNLCLFNTSYKGKDAITTIFSIPINSDESGAKSVAERVMEVVSVLEKCFITLDYVKSEEVKEDKFVYVTIIKILEGENNEANEGKIAKEKSNKRKSKTSNKN